MFRSIVCRSALLLALLPLANGCVSMHSFSDEEETAPTAVVAETCALKWATANVEVYRRDRVLIATTSWSRVQRHESDLLGIIQRETDSHCTGKEAKPVQEVTVDAYYLSYVNRPLRAASASMILASAYTLGTLPWYGEDKFAVCLGFQLPDGQHRYGLAQGKIRSLENLWGIGSERRNGADPRATVRAARRADEMFESLGRQAFRKAWGGGEAIVDCKDALNSLIE